MFRFLVLLSLLSSTIALRSSGISTRTWRRPTRLHMEPVTESDESSSSLSSQFVKARSHRTALSAVESHTNSNGGGGVFGRFGEVRLPLSNNYNKKSSKDLEVVNKKNGGKSKILTVEEEHELSRQIQILCKLKVKKDNLAAKLSRPPTDDEWAAVIGCSKKALLKQVKRSQIAKGKLVQANTGIVRIIAKNYENSGVLLADLIQEGNLGLLEAADRFVPEKGFKFCTYAAWWVRQRIGRSIAANSRVIRLPVYVHNILGTMAKTTNIMTDELGRKPTEEEVATRMNVPLNKLKMYAASSKNVLSLELPVTHRHDEKRKLSDSLTWDGADPVDNMEVEALRTELVQVMDELDDREKAVVRMRFGLDDGICKSRAELAEELNVSRERVRLIEVKALNKLRHPNKKFRLKDYLGSFVK